MTGTAWTTAVFVLVCGSLVSCMTRAEYELERQESEAEHRRWMDELLAPGKADAAERQQQSEARARQWREDMQAAEQRVEQSRAQHREALIKEGFKHPDLRIYMKGQFGSYRWVEAEDAGVVCDMVDKATLEELADVETEHLAAAWALTKSLRIETELKRRKVFTDEQWKQIHLGAIHMGDPSMVVRAAWGRPRQISETATAAGKWTTWTYGRSGETLVQFENDVVSLVHR